ncbi:MAG: pyrroline-5-carboxylate reductase [Deltaproteobacteria bacterium]|nr:pyrroline-5-carboxylate reductase [Deltaproteobacteria bacterium]
MLTKKTIGFIGAGNMGEALIKGLIGSKKITPAQILVADKVKERLAYIAEHYEAKVFTKNFEVAKGADIIILAVKPNDIKAALEEIGSDLNKGKLLISIAAGITMDFILGNLPHAVPLIRVMPNTPALVLEGAIGICPGEGVSKEDRDIAVAIFEAVGKVVLIENEELMDAVTGLSGSGPAYVFLILEALSDAGISVGLSRKIANLLAIQTVLGAAKLAMESGKHFGELKDMVTSPGGTTIAGIEKLEQGSIRATIIKAVEAATKRSKELSGSR